MPSTARIVAWSFRAAMGRCNERRGGKFQMKPNGQLGTVKFYDPAASNGGFGFIACDSGIDLYFHATAINESSRPPAAGDRVKFIAGLSRRGRSLARNVAVLQTVGSKISTVLNHFQKPTG